MKVCEVMGKPHVVNPETTVHEAARILVENGITTLFIVIGHRVIGLLTDMDIIRRCVIPNRIATELRVDEIMSSKLITVDADASVEYAARLMLNNKIKRLPVVSKGKFIGIITTDYISAHADELGVDSLF